MSSIQTSLYTVYIGTNPSYAVHDPKRACLGNLEHVMQTVPGLKPDFCLTFKFESIMLPAYCVI